MKRTKLQNSIIHWLKTKTKIDQEAYEVLVSNLTNGRTTTSAEMTVAEANELIKALGGTAPEAGKRTRQLRQKKAGVVTLATGAQLDLLRALAVRRWGAEHAEKTLAKFCESPRVIGKPVPHTSKEASRAIEILKSKIRSEKKEAA